MNLDPGKLKITAEKWKSYAERNGLKPVLFRSLQGIGEVLSDRAYSVRMKAGRFQQYEANLPLPESRPFISLIVPAYETDRTALIRLLWSVSMQTYRNFELILVDGSESGRVEETAAAFFQDPETDLPLIYHRLPRNLGISGNTNMGLRLAAGEYAAFLDHDDFLEPDCLYETALALDRGADLVYTDEDKYDGAADRYLSPNRKPDFNLDLLLSNNYICHLLTVRTEIAREAGGFRSAYDGAQDYDFILRLAERIPPEKIIHVPKVLYHWNLSETSTAGNPGSKLYAYENGRKAVEDYFRRRGLPFAAEHTEHRGFYHPVYRGEGIPESSYRVLLDGRLTLCSSYGVEQLTGHLARPEVGIVGGRIVGKTGRIVCNGYTTDSCGRRVSLYAKMNRNFSGAMHRAGLTQDVEAVSRHACVIRSELLDCLSGDSMEMCRKIRERGYLVLLDPSVCFRIGQGKTPGPA